MHVREIRKLDDSELRKELNGKKRALMDLRFNKTSGQLADTSQLHKTQRDVARIMTVIREREIIFKLSDTDNGK